MSVFVAWMPDEDALDALRALCDAVDGALAPGLRPKWRKREQFHMTLRYLGEDMPADLAPLSAALAAVAARHARIALAFDRTERWKRDELLVACTAPSAPLDALFADIEHAVRGCGFGAQAPEKTPHVTLAYAPRGGSIAAEANAAARAALPFAATLGRIAVASTVRGGYNTPAWWPLDDRADAAVDGAALPR
jgi:2'-5' RNA ligase